MPLFVAGALLFAALSIPQASAYTQPCDDPRSELGPVMREICYSYPWTVVWTAYRDVVVRTIMDVYCPGQPQCELP